jgi:hypothetical protein
VVVADPGLVELHVLGQEHLQRPGPVGVALEVALLLEHLQLVGDARGAGQPDRLADLAHARGIAALVEARLDVLEHALLPLREPGGVGRTVRELGDGLGCALVSHG